MPHIKISDQDLFYAARGASGAPLLFVHGAGDSHLLWNGQLAAFAGSVQGIALDLPGHGRSTGQGRTAIMGYALAVREFMDALGIERAVVAGISMGGAIAQLLALEFPARVERLVLVGTGARLRVAPQYLDGIKSDFAAAARALVENYFAPGAPAELEDKSLRQLLATGSAVTYGDFAACDAFDVRERVQNIACPTLVVCGRADRMTPVRYSESLAQSIPHARLAIIENAGHMVMLEQPTEFHRIVNLWLAS